MWLKLLGYTVYPIYIHDTFGCYLVFIVPKSAEKNFPIPSNPQPIGFRGNLLVKRPKFFYCTYSLGITETS